MLARLILTTAALAAASGCSRPMPVKIIDVYETSHPGLPVGGKVWRTTLEADNGVRVTVAGRLGAIGEAIHISPATRWMDQ
jgi:hypothetical protein